MSKRAVVNYPMPRAKRKTRPLGVPVRAKPVFVFEPNSFDAQFATLHTLLGEQNHSRNVRMDAQDQVLEEIKAQTSKTNGRVTVLEKKWEGKWKWVAGYIAGASGVIVAAVTLIRILWH